MEGGEIDKVSLSVGGFYGARNKRKWIGLERSVDNAVKKHKEDKIPTAFKSRILGPSTKWETFYRQQDAFSFARSTAKNLHVFAFESETLVGDTGQRMYLVASYPVFWHYYSQIQAEKRHHYEIIPEGAVCKLYFDLEYDMSANPGSHGDTMVETLIKYVCVCVKKEFRLDVRRENILDLQASTDKKFSRHLIFQLKNSAFRNNIHAGKFVCHIMSELLDYVKAIRDSHSNSDNKETTNNSHLGTDTKLADLPRTASGPSRNNTVDNGLPSEDLNGVHNERVNNAGDAETAYNITEEQISSNQSTMRNSEVPSTRETSTDSELSSNAAPRNCSQDKNKNVENYQTENQNNCHYSKEVKRGENCVAKPNFSDILSGFSVEELTSLVVKNKHGEDTLFCDTGVYTKNRNFRLFMSSKLGKRNPLTVSNQNQYIPDKGSNSEEETFYDCLVANVQYNEKMKILSYDYESPESIRMGRSQRSSQERIAASTIEGYSKSPYPEVDDFIIGLISQDDGRGVIRHWTYFQQGELLVYEISRFRYCHNIGREHRSNNIMYIADLRRGIYYQKCHDPDCQSQSFKSQDWSLPREVLPAHYFDELSDDMDFEVEDEEFLNSTAEMERQYFLNQSKESGGEDLSLTLEDGDDDDLMTAVDQVEAEQCS